jgi:hypothetical protein
MAQDGLQEVDDQRVCSGSASHTSLFQRIIGM